MTTLTPEQLLTQSEVCQRLRISSKKLQILRRTRRLPYLRFGHRTIRFRESDVNRFLEKAALPQG